MSALLLTEEEVALIQARRTNGHVPPPPPGNKTGKVIVVVSPKGGSGKTAVDIAGLLQVPLVAEATTEPPQSDLGPQRWRAVSDGGHR